MHRSLEGRLPGKCSLAELQTLKVDLASFQDEIATRSETGKLSADAMHPLTLLAKSWLSNYIQKTCPLTVRSALAAFGREAAFSENRVLVSMTLDQVTLIEHLRDTLRPDASVRNFLVWLTEQVYASEYLMHELAQEVPTLPKGLSVDGSRLTCLECFRSFRDISSHVRQKHGMDFEMYISRNNLPQDYPRSIREAIEQRKLE